MPAKRRRLRVRTVADDFDLRFSLNQLFFAALFLASGVIVYGAVVRGNFGASFYLCCVAVLFYVGAAVLQLKTLQSADTT